jgi:hypothetical protein
MQNSFTFFQFLKKILFYFIVLFACYHANAQVSGKVFKDFNANGTFDTGATYNEVGQPGVVVNAYDAAGTALAVTYTGGGTVTNNTGDYSVAGATPGQVRLEFVLPDTYTFASKGSTGGTTVMFPMSGTQDLAVNYPAEYCSSTNPRIYTTLFFNGNNQVSGSGAANGNSVITFNYDKSSKVNNGLQSSTGAVWGVAHHKKSDKMYFASFTKRHSNWGPLGPNGLYVVDNANTANSTSATSSFVNLNTINPAFDAGTVVRNFTPGNGDPNSPNYDEQVFNKIGKIGLGDIDIDDDNHHLFVVNLNDRKLWRVEIGLGGQAPTTSSQIVDYPSFPNPCINSIFRPFATKIYKGFVYVGGICDGVTTDETAVDRNNLKMTIYKADLSVAPSIATWVQVFDAPLTFNRDANLNAGFGIPSSDRYNDPNGQDNSLSISSWHPWARNEADVTLESSNYFYPQPILSDIEFDVDGSMILGFIDRMGHQGGYYNYSTNTSSTSTKYTTGIGDIMRVHNDNGTYILESNGSAGGVSTAGAGNGDGPGGGEYYYQDRFECCGLGNTAGPAVNHDETSVGGLALLAGKNEVLNSVFDAADSWESGGVRWYNNTTGVATAGLLIYGNNSPDFFGKAHGIGDIELVCTPAPIEIGNRVFMDTDEDGEQDAGEMGLDGIKVELWKAGAKVTETTTANGGQWFFGNLDAATAYEVKILAADIPSGKQLTTSNTAANAKDLIDNDATLVGSDAVIAYKTGNAGENNHSLDFGFKVGCTQPSAITFTQIAPTCTGATANNDGKITFTSILNADKYFINTGATSTGTYVTATALPATGADLQTSIPNAGETYTIRFYNGSDACYKDTTITVAAVNCACTNPNAGTDQTLSCSGATAPTTATLSAAPSGHTWFVTTQPSGASATVNNAGAAANMTVAGDYIFELRNDADPTCKDDVKVTIPNCASPCPTPNCGSLSVRKL